MRIPLFQVYHDDSMEDRAIEVLRSGSIASGPYIAQFNEAFGRLLKQPHVVTTNDMSSALQIAFRLAGIGAGDEVLTSPFACLSTNAPIATSGAFPRWVDLDPHTGAMDLASLSRVLTPRCKALVLYHLAGYPGPVEEVAGFCRDHNLVLIEDCDNALLATMNGRHVGFWGGYSVYSFYPNRHINATEGGALICSNADEAARGIRLRRHGIDLDTFRLKDGEINPGSDIAEIGWAATLNNLCSGLALVQVSTIANRIEAARANARFFDQAFDGLGSIKPLVPLAGAMPSYWVYLVRARRQADLLASLKSDGIGCSKLHLLNTEYSGFGIPKVDLPGARDLMETIVALPCGWWLTAKDRQTIADSIRFFDGRVGT